MKSNLLALMVLSVAAISCSDGPKKEGRTSSPRIKSSSKIASPKNLQRFTMGDTIRFEVTLDDEGINLDSVVCSHEKTGRTTYRDLGFQIPTHGFKTGKNNFTLDIHLSNGDIEKRRATIVVKSDIDPVTYTYRVVNSFPHDNEAFVQGLLIDEGVMYESTGQKGYSSLRRVDLTSGKILQRKEISSEYFGEGIAIFNDKIYMLTWHAGKGFVFDKETFEPVREFTYPTEGWGLTTKDDTLLMSDGSENIFFMEPAGFTEVKRIEVYDQNGPVDNLNELEYFNGILYANRWTTDLIYQIDPNCGKVLGVIDLTGIIDENVYDEPMDVLNGVAFDQSNGAMYVTGKDWPLLFQIELISKKNKTS